MRCLQTIYSNICVNISIFLLIHRYRGPPSPAGEGYTKKDFIGFYSKKYFFDRLSHNHRKKESLPQQGKVAAAG